MERSKKCTFRIWEIQFTEMCISWGLYKQDCFHFNDKLRTLPHSILISTWKIQHWKICQGQLLIFLQCWFVIFVGNTSLWKFALNKMEFKIGGAHNLILWKLLCRALGSALVFAGVEFSKKIIVGNREEVSINSNSIRGTKHFLSPPYFECSSIFVSSLRIFGLHNKQMHMTSIWTNSVW